MIMRRKGEILRTVSEVYFWLWKRLWSKELGGFSGRMPGGRGLDSPSKRNLECTKESSFRYYLEAVRTLSLTVCWANSP